MPVWNPDNADQSMMVRKRKGHNRRPRKCETIIKDAKEFSSVTTVHGISYLASSDHSIFSRFFWIVTVILAIMGTSYQVFSMWNLWGESPVITTLDTISFPIEKIEFPAVTLCPQGSVHDIMDAVLYYQFEEWVIRKIEKDEEARHKRSIRNGTYHSINIWKFLTNQKLSELLTDFLSEVYPGAEDLPTKFVDLLNSDDPDATIESNSILMPENDRSCDENDNQELLNHLKQKFGQECPQGYYKFNSTTCIRLVDVEMTYDDASRYCRNKEEATILSLESWEEIEEFQKSNILGTSEFQIIFKRLNFI